MSGTVGSTVEAPSGRSAAALSSALGSGRWPGGGGSLALVVMSGLAAPASHVPSVCLGFLCKTRSWDSVASVGLPAPAKSVCD